MRERNIFKFNKRETTTTPTKLNELITILRSLEGVELPADQTAVNTHTSFKDDLSMDSIDRLFMVQAIEVKYGIEISDQESEGLETIGDVLKCIEGKLMKKTKS